MIRGDINGASPRRGGAHIFYEGEIHLMQTASARDERFRPIALGAEIFYALFSAYLVVSGAVTGNSYRLTMGIGTYFLYPLFWAFYKLFHLRRGYQMEFCVFFFTFLAYPLGGTAEFYQKIQGFDKVAHTLSGVFVAMLALTLFLILQRKRPLKEHSVPTAVLFVFFASMAVAGLFELCEWTAAALTGRDLQCVLTTGVNDTMQDMLVCLIGTLLFCPLIPRFYRGGYDPLTGAVAGFLEKNGLCARGE